MRAIHANVAPQRAGHTTARKPARWFTVAIASCIALGGCSSVLGIEDAQFDASLESTDTSASLPSTGGASHHGGTSHSTTQAGGTSDASGNSSGGSTAQVGRTTCERYCDATLANCSGELEQYRNLHQCLEVCARLPEGERGDENKNTVSCRLRLAEFAENEPSVYCKSAGPLGQDRCGSNCEAYCTLMQSTCTPESTANNFEPSTYPSTTACLTACAGLAPSTNDPKAYTSSPKAMPSTYVGDHVFCRTYHLAAALDDAAADEHCPHAMGGDPCIKQ